MIRGFLQSQNGKIFANFIKNSFIYKAMQKSVGDFWYPFYVIKWKIASCIKMDTDGNELKIIEGAKKTSANPQLHALVIEMPDEDKIDKCASILSSFGFVPEWVCPELTRNEVWLRQGIK